MLYCLHCAIHALNFVYSMLRDIGLTSDEVGRGMGEVTSRFDDSMRRSVAMCDHVEACRGVRAIILRTSAGGHHLTDMTCTGTRWLKVIPGIM